MMLQKPSSKSKHSDHSRYLSKRLTWWKEGKLKDIMSEAKEIQRRLSAPKRRSKEEGKLRGFTRMMMTGKVKQALRLVDADNVIAGIHVINDDIRANLQAKHQTHGNVYSVPKLSESCQMSWQRKWHVWHEGSAMRNSHTQLSICSSMPGL